MVSIHSEGTFGRLRYSFGGDRPSQTAHLTLSIHRFHGAMLEFQQQKSGIPTAAPTRPESCLPSLPPILCIRYRNPISGYSQALRGRFHGAMLEFQQQKSGIPTVAPPRPESWLPSLPPILCIRYRNPISGYSQALRGLSVQSRVMGIFTHTSISPGPLLRQRSNRYTIRAGRNLPDKEFRYLRTVIVTAAVYWGFGSMLLLR